MPAFSIQSRAGQRIAIFDECGHAELIDIDDQRDEAGNLIVTDHVLSRNIYGDDDIYDDVSAYFRGEPVLVLPANTLCIANDNITPALLEVHTPLNLSLVA